MVPPDQVEPLRAAVRRFLHASYLERQDQSRADVEFLALRDLARTLPEPAASLLARVNDRDVAHLGACLGSALERSVVADGLSPARSPLPAAPVFLLHGADDTVIPSTQSEHLAARLRLARVPVRLLVTDLLSHGDVTRSIGVVDLWQLSAFWGEVLAP